MGENCPRLISHHRYDEGNYGKYPAAAYRYHSHHSSHPLILPRAHSFPSRERTPGFYDKLESSFLTADNCAHQGYTKLHPERAQLFYDNPKGDFLCAGDASHAPMFGPSPLFGWGSVMPRGHSYGQPKYLRYQKPDHRRFCYSVGKAEVPYASLPGGPLWGYPAHMAEQLTSNDGRDADVKDGQSIEHEHQVSIAMPAQPPEQMMPGGFPNNFPQDSPDYPDQYFYQDQQTPPGDHNSYTSNTSPAHGNDNIGAQGQQEGQQSFQRDRPNSPAINQHPSTPNCQPQPLPPQIRDHYPPSQGPQHQWPPPDSHYYHHTPHQVYCPRKYAAPRLLTKIYEEYDGDRSYHPQRHMKKYKGRKEQERRVLPYPASMMQMIMMNQMMMQQMQSQQMQAAQMAAMAQQTFQNVQNCGNNNNQNCNQNNQRDPRKRRRKSEPAVNIQTIQYMPRRKKFPRTKVIQAASHQGPEIAVLQPPHNGKKPDLARKYLSS
ncbi:hypothetical protein I352_00745 [Cryptococcus deuterogattii MMRL2647]|nr:hypothetical protein I352_00745 [Cryptococcus deuterogattii MMRL2647]